CKAQVDKFTDVIFDIIYKTPNASMICEMFGLCFGPDTLQCSLTNRLATGLNALNKYLQPLLSKMARDRETPVMDHVTDLITKKYPQVKLMKHL
ncbi:hypothetical protein PoB_001970200, partial [Plakobranchus ocellatus]